MSWDDIRAVVKASVEGMKFSKRNRCEIRVVVSSASHSAMKLGVTALPVGFVFSESIFTLNFSAAEEQQCLELSEKLQRLEV